MLDELHAARTMGPPVEADSEAVMVARKRWEEIRRLFCDERVSIAEIARRLQLDRKTVRRCIRQEQWQPYQRPPKQETLLTEHADFLRERAAQVRYSAQILSRSCDVIAAIDGSYETVKRFVGAVARAAAGGRSNPAAFRDCTGPAEPDRLGPGDRRLPQWPAPDSFFVLTLGYSRRGFYCRLT